MFKIRFWIRTWKLKNSRSRHWQTIAIKTNHRSHTDLPQIYQNHFKRIMFYQVSGVCVTFSSGLRNKRFSFSRTVLNDAFNIYEFTSFAFRRCKVGLVPLRPEGVRNVDVNWNPNEDVVISGVFKRGHGAMPPLWPDRENFLQATISKKCVFCRFPASTAKFNNVWRSSFIPIQYAIKITMCDCIYHDAPTSPSAFENQLQAVLA